MDNAIRKKALRQLTYGLYVATARAGERYATGTVTWLSQCSFEPPLVMAGFKRESKLREVVTASRAFAVHVIGKSQKKLATTFFKTAVHRGNTLSGFPFDEGVTGSPVLRDAPAWFECRVVDHLQRGDHWIYVGEIVAAGVRRDEEPLTLREARFSYAG